MNGDIILTDGEKKIVRALSRLEKLWEQHGENLLLFNGQSLRYKGVDISCELTSFPSIKGDGGDGGDKF